MVDSAPRHMAVTGASSGIGRALALAYAAPGVTLGLLGRDAERLEASGQACRRRGAQVRTGSIDVRDAEALKAWLDAFDADHPIDLLIANAGASSTLAHAGEWEDLARTTHIVDTNFYGALHAALPVIERMLARGQGQIALVASLVALRGMSIAPAYSASKAALKAWGDAVRPLLQRRGIAVSVVLPGFVKTAMSDSYPADKPLMWSAEQAADYIRRKVAARRAEIAFPFLLQLGARLQTLLPTAWADRQSFSQSFNSPDGPSSGGDAKH